MPLKRFQQLGVAIWSVVALSQAFAYDGDGPWDRTNVSGFGTVGAGRVISGGMPSWTNRLDGQNCPCLIVDWAHGAEYTGSWNANPETKMGVQIDTDFTSTLSGTLQLVGRTAPMVKHKVGVEWLYGTYKLDPNWTIQVGRKRLPIDYYSDVQDIGNAYVWIRPSEEVYGWDIVNYNGANITYHNAFDELSLNASIFTGAEHSRDYALGKIFTLNQFNQTSPFAPKNRIDANWTNIIGAHAEVNYQWLTARLVYTQFDDQKISFVTGAPVPTTPPRKREIFGYAILADSGNWIFIHEYSYFKRDAINTSPPDNNYISISFSGGYRWHKLTSMYSVSSFRDEGPGSGNDRRNNSFSLRYDITPHSDVKFQFEVERPELPNGVGAISGPAKEIAVSYDFTF